MKTKLLIALTLILSLFSACPDFKTPVAYADGQEGTMPESEHAQANKEEKNDEKMKEEHMHHKGMHGMMMGHSKGWMIVIGVVMVVMMAAMVL